VKVFVVPSSVSERSENQHQFLTSYVINDTVAIDAGCLGLNGTAQEQARLKHVLISHTHVDHLGSLPIFVENAYEARTDCVTVYGNESVLKCLHTDIFNDRVWPDFIALSRDAKAPFLRLVQIEAGKAITLSDLRITPVAVNHVVPTLGFIVEDGSAAAVVVSDTGPTENIWQQANETANLKAVFLEATFPNAMSRLADVSKHLTPAQFGVEIQKLKQRAKIIAVHIKARYRDEVVKELLALGHLDLEIGRFGTAYTF
jgi:ribonuclease BN (tRNA processing enzyme)